MSLRNILNRDYLPWKKVGLSELNENIFPSTKAPKDSVLFAKETGSLEWLETGEMYNSPPSVIVYQPGGSDVLPFVRDWSSVKSLIDKTNGIITVLFDDSLGTCLIDSSTDCKSNTYFKPYKEQSGSGKTHVYIADGVSLLDLRGVGGTIRMHNRSTNSSPLEFSSSNGILFLDNESSLYNDTSSSKPFIDIGDGNSFWLIGTRASIYNTSSTSVINLGTSSSGGIIGIFNCYFDNNIVSGDNTTSFEYYFQSGCNVFTNSGFSGNFITTRTDNSSEINYNDNLVNPQLGSSLVQGALDNLKTKSYINYGFFKNNLQTEIVEIGNITRIESGVGPSHPDYSNYNNYMSNDFSFTNGIATYTGSVSKVFKISVSCSVYMPSGIGNTMIFFYIRKNEGSIISSGATTNLLIPGHISGTYPVNMSIEWLEWLSEGETIDVCVTNLDSADSPVVSNLQVIISNI